MDWSIDYYRGRGKGILKLQHVQRSFARTWGKTMVVGGYIAHHQVHTIFQPLPRKVPPDHMCHKWPIGRACSGLRTLNWSLRFFLPNKPLRTLRTFFLCGRLWDTGSQIFCWKKKKSAENWDPVPPNWLQKKNTDFSIFQFSAELHYTNCVPDFCWKKFFSAELSIQTYASAELIFWFCVVDFCWFNGFP